MTLITLSSRFSNADFRRANLTNCSATGCRVEAVNYAEAKLVLTNFAGRVMPSTRFYGTGPLWASTNQDARYRFADNHVDEYLRDASDPAQCFAAAAISVVDFTGCDLTGAAFAAAPPQFREEVQRGMKSAKPVFFKLLFRKCDISQADFSNANLAGVDLKGINLKGSTFHNTNLFGAQLQRSQLQGINLATCNLVNANLAGISYSDATAFPPEFGIPGDSTNSDVERRDVERTRKETITGALTIGLVFFVIVVSSIVSTVLSGTGSKQVNQTSLVPQKQTEPAPTPAESGDMPSEITNSIGMRLKLIPAGEFLMGSPETEAGRKDDEKQHRVRITKPFYLGVHEVTQAEYKRVMGTNPSHFQGARNPVESVSWDDAVNFCQRLSDLPAERSAGHVYRLPTEAEWEYACRAGTTTAYSFGDSATALGEYGWYGVNSQNMSHPVGEKEANGFGLYDMHGNVWEWCEDRHGEYPGVDTTDPHGPSTGSVRVFRGGGWGGTPASVRSANRDWYSPGNRDISLGFRLARSSIE